MATNRRYLEMLSTIEDARPGANKLNKLSKTARQRNRSYPGFNFFDEDNQMLFEAIARGEYNISGRISRLLKRRRVHGRIKRIARTYKYYLTQFGKLVIAAGVKLKELVIIPRLAFSPAR